MLDLGDPIPGRARAVRTAREAAVVGTGELKGRERRSRDRRGVGGGGSEGEEQLQKILEGQWSGRMEGFEQRDSAMTPCGLRGPPSAAVWRGHRGSGGLCLQILVGF